MDSSSEDELSTLPHSITNIDQKSEIVEVSPKGRFYRVIFTKFNDELGCGAFKVVFRGFDNDQGCEIAWNIINLKNMSSHDRSHISEELKLNRRLKHPNIVSFISAWTNSLKEELVIITEIVTGGSLKQYLKKIKNPRLKVIKLWCKGILSGLNYLHSQNPYPIIHRDLKCANVLIMSNTGDVKIGDFGLSTLMQDKMQTSVLGTPEYMAPEVYKGFYDTKIDIYSFGMCVIEMCTLKSPYSECNNQAMIYKKVMSGEPPAALLHIDNLQVVEFIKKCLIQYEQRPTAEDLLKDKFLSIQEEDDKIHHSLSIVHSPKSNKSSISSSMSTIDVSLIINDNKETRQISFPYNLENDTPEKVAKEMIEELNLDENLLIRVANEIESKVKYASNEGLVNFLEYETPIQIGVTHPSKCIPSMDLDYIDCFTYKKDQFVYKFANTNKLSESKTDDLEEFQGISNFTRRSSMKTVRSENDLAKMAMISSMLCMKKGVENDRGAVKRLQCLLSGALGQALKVDGFFGKKVEAQVKLFQETIGFRPDGIVNNEIWEKLMTYPKQGQS
ncbi:hypothetical protein SteCoe_25049 [Stentor coeruleus]|uniref:non-specific serine/threonine protein kinase n=1 Tax=Stentor coeruleus TaxID=5963 RepID=A0A1R2BG46_9CILI|nr:hypothetical protein SteCoe_25049 [Stentor coeruleus]